MFILSFSAIPANKVHNRPIPFLIIRPQAVNLHRQHKQLSFLWRELVREQLNAPEKVDHAIADFEMHRLARDRDVFREFVNNGDSGQDDSIAVEAKENHAAPRSHLLRLTPFLPHPNPLASSSRTAALQDPSQRTPLGVSASSRAATRRPPALVVPRLQPPPASPREGPIASLRRAPATCRSTTRRRLPTACRAGRLLCSRAPPPSVRQASNEAAGTMFIRRAHTFGRQEKALDVGHQRELKKHRIDQGQGGLLLAKI
ncbi:uncharacterized protein LOC133907998 [Phragmites australis]|uniref:uncharacterized protein LOC133907998 n=1 Tax=Phragmites australis TaxID=29695 RepID=UPI002D78480F|nr:uncharacterized protein LOC133907998 [Phragmites australis]